MKVLSTTALAGAFAIVGATAQAAYLYEASSYDTVAGSHSVWISTGLGGGIGTDFNFDPVGLFLTNKVDFGQLSGRLVSADSTPADENGFIMDFSYDGTFVDSHGNPFNPLFKDEGPDGPAEYFLNLVGGTLKGFGSKLEGLNLKVEAKPIDGPYATQVGDASNAKNNNYGLANWFTVFLDGDLADQTCAICTNNQTIANLANGVQGDVNINLELIDDNAVIPDVPLPAAGWMLIAGVGGMVAAGRRKKAAKKA